MAEQKKDDPGSAAAAPSKRSESPAGAEPSSPPVKSLQDTAKISELTVGELTAMISAEVARAGIAGRAGSHVNSGPPGFVNGGGHANFDPRVTKPGGALAGVHVNSGPPGFVNGGGHANFDPRVTKPGGALAGVHVNSGPPGFVNGGGHANFDPRVTNPGGALAGVHVNSGPPGFVNGGGHANFDPRVTNPGSIAGSHVNSGPPGFVNGGGHANFDPRVTKPGIMQTLTLPDGTRVEVPATGALDFKIRGFHITR